MALDFKHRENTNDEETLTARDVDFGGRLFFNKLPFNKPSRGRAKSQPAFLPRGQ